MNDIVAVMRAADFAARKHKKQRRKGEEAEPYFNHLIEVASLVAEASEGWLEFVVAALLHDAVEDQDVTSQAIAEEFGSAVAALVAEVTDDKSLPKPERKARQIANAPHKSEGAAIIKIADKTSNLRAIAKSPPPWLDDRKREYVQWASAVVAGLQFKPAALMEHFNEAANEAMKSLGN